MNQDKYQPPQTSIGDTAHTIAKAAIASLPIVGGAGVEFFSSLITPPLQRRQKVWMEEVGDSLRKLVESSHTLDNLQENEQFIDVVMHASQAAIRTSQAEKRHALRNAILNAAVTPQSIDTVMQHIFINLIDEFTTWHLRLLKFSQNPYAWSIKHDHKFPYIYNSMGYLSDLFVNAFPELSNNEFIVDKVWNDCFVHGMVDINVPQVPINGNLAKNQVSELGNKFLTFIEYED